MKALVFHGVGDIRLDDVEKPKMQEPGDAIVRLRTIGVIDVFLPQAMTFPIGVLQFRNLAASGGNCNHRKYIPRLVGLVGTGTLDPSKILTNTEPVTGAIEVYETFDRRPGWIKVELDPAA